MGRTIQDVIRMKPYLSFIDISTFSVKERISLQKRYALHKKYEKALALYKNTSLTMKEIVSQTGVPAEAFRFYVHKWHKDLVCERLGIKEEIDENTDLRKARKKMKTVAAKYEKAIESLRNNPRPVTKVAEEYGFNADVFRNYLHKHEQPNVHQAVHKNPYILF